MSAGDDRGRVQEPDQICAGAVLQEQQRTRTKQPEKRSRVEVGLFFTLLGDRGRFVDDATGLVIPPGNGFRAALGLSEGGPLFGFTKANELFVGRLAQLGIAFSLIGEIITGKGALAQLNIETGVPINEIEPLLLFSILFFFFAAINPGTGKFVTDDDQQE